MHAPEHEDELIVPAREGTLCLLRAARDAGVKRVVLTSSCGAIYYGHKPQREPFNETHWSVLDGEMSAYVKSKIVAERAAWDFIAAQGGNLEMSVINPAGIFGPLLAAHCPSSVNVMKRLLDGMPGCPQISFGIVDVRDVADLRVRAMTDAAAIGERLDIAKVLRAHMGATARRVPRLQSPNWLVRLGAEQIRQCGNCCQCWVRFEMPAVTKLSGCSAGCLVRMRKRYSPQPKACCGSGLSKIEVRLGRTTQQRI